MGNSGNQRRERVGKAKRGVEVDTVASSAQCCAVAFFIAPHPPLSPIFSSLGTFTLPSQVIHSVEAIGGSFQRHTPGR